MSDEVVGLIREPEKKLRQKPVQNAEAF